MPQRGKKTQTPPQSEPQPQPQPEPDPGPSFITQGVLARHDPVGPRLPVVFDSPHSGLEYPPDFGHALSREDLRSTEDRFVDELFGSASFYGASLLKALFPRCYIDPNRHPLDLDQSMLDGEWPETLQPGSKSRNGKGLIRSRVNGTDIYDRRLGVNEVSSRLEGYWQPYHNALAALLAERHQEFGAVWHLNCHSWTPPRNGRDGNPVRHLDICLGDRDATTCDPDFTAFVSETLSEMGYVVRINRPFKGMELVRRHGAPHQQRYSLQIEINRNLYLDNSRYQKTAGFEELRENLERLIATICDYVHAALPA